MRTFLKNIVPRTLPVMTGYLFLGFSFGIFARSQGISPLMTLLTSLLIYSGTLQFAAVSVLQTAFDPLGILLLSLMVSARMLFYGITLLEKYKGLRPGAKQVLFLA